MGSILRLLKGVFKKKPSRPSADEIWYFSAYNALPRIALRDPRRFWENTSQSERKAAVWYLILCQLLQAEPNLEEVAALEIRLAELEDGRKVMVLIYPSPEPITLKEEDLTLEALKNLGRPLGVYFSALLLPHKEQPASCYALGQSPIGGRTTLRRCTQGAHYNLGEGPEPSEQAFLAALQTADQIRPTAAAVHTPELLTQIDEHLRQGLYAKSPEELKKLVDLDEG